MLVGLMWITPNTESGLRTSFLEQQDTLVHTRILQTCLIFKVPEGCLGFGGSAKHY